MPKLYYFDLYGRAEVSRQALTLSGTAFEDIRVSGDSWKELKESGKCEFGSVPVLELDDGTRLAQSTSILRYINWTWGKDKLQQSDDALKLYNADSLVEYWVGDHAPKFQPIIFSHVFNPNADAAERDAKFTEYLKLVPDALAVMERRLPADSKFLLGDKPSIYDIQLG